MDSTQRHTLQESAFPQEDFDNEKLYRIDYQDDESYCPVKESRFLSAVSAASATTNASLNSDDGKLVNIQVDTSGINTFVDQYASFAMTIILTGLSAWTRYRDIVGNTNVSWDEAHFGKFGSLYIKRSHYFDVHPPLAKMLVGLSGVLAGYDGSFDFTSGAPYPDINYRFMRLFNATFGVVMVPIAYWTARELKMSRTGATLAATMVLLDNAYLTISRYILLDSMLLSSTFFVVLAYVKFKNARREPFSARWWLWLSLTGLGIGCVASVKWVGLFATALVGLHTIEELWDLLGDLKLSWTKYITHWIARILFLIALPMGIYVACFVAHFKILTNTGSGDANMNSLFQAGLNGSTLKDNPLEVAFGSKVTIKNNGHGGGLLHSHIQTYPEGSLQQQVTLYSHRDHNNEFVIQKGHGEVESDTIEIVKDGAILRLLHKSTGRHLHSHPVRAPLTRDQWEVSGYGNPNEDDENDDWILETVDERAHNPRDGTLRSLTTTIRLRHRVLGCLLSAESSKHLPPWGFSQTEVYCDQRNQTSSAYSIWNVEEHWNDKLPKGDASQYKSSFWRNFLHLNVAMLLANNGLIPDPDKLDQLASLPSQWPLLAVGLRMGGWNDNQTKVYLLGNPIVWWSGTLSLLVFAVTWIYYSITRARAEAAAIAAEKKDREETTTISIQKKSSGTTTMTTSVTTSAADSIISRDDWVEFHSTGKILIGGWFLHYMPFCVMGRVTYLHHYFPALYFTILLCTYLTDHFLKRPGTRLQTKVLVWTVAFAAVISTFLWFAPLSYGKSSRSGEGENPARTSRLSTTSITMVNAETFSVTSLDGKIVYPQVRRVDTTHTQHGVTVADPYSWLENLDSEETKSFIEDQNKISAEVIDKFEDRQKFRERLTELFDFERFGSPRNHGDYYYYFHNSGLQPQNIIYQQDVIGSEPRVFLDPSLLEADGTASLKTYEFSRSGELFAYAISKSGSDWSTVYLKDCHGNKLDDVIEWVKFTQFAFTHDDKGFFYSSYERPNVDAVKAGTETSANSNHRLLYLRIGTPQSEDVLVHCDTENPLYRFTPEISDDGKYILMTIRKGSLTCMLYVGDLDATGGVTSSGYDWNKIVDNFDAKYFYLTNDGTVFYFRTNKDAPRSRIVKYDLIKPTEGFVDLVPQAEDVLVGGLVVDGNKLVLNYMRDVKDVLALYDLTTGQFVHEIPLPVGTVANIIGNRESKEFFIFFTSFLTPGTIYRYDFSVEDQEQRLSIFREVKVKDFDNTLFETKQIFYESKDGTKIPMFVTHRKDLVFDGNNPTFLHGYGGFSMSVTSSCTIAYIVFMQHFGGVIAIANLRGGGEYGQEWHRAGTLLNKQNVFDDFQYAAKYLIREKYTQPSKLAINGQSNGGLLVAACVNQTPELFGAAVAEVAGLDMLRFHKFTIGHAWQSEYGYPDDNSEDFHNLLKYSPLHNIHKNKPYPAFALFTSDHDDRVVPLHSFKHIAELQHTAGPFTKNPLILRTQTKAGHGAGKPLTKRIEDTTDKFSFIAAALGATWRD
ncbi:hypothetical protein BGZ83_004374 [Gryganskiella cystojenkinii]|nr:hypothetical protein BGZ83_004374 [Gryganskiella cystojenkinii]